MNAHPYPTAARRALLALGAVLVVLAPSLVADPSGAVGDSIRVEGTSTLHAWAVESQTVKGTVADLPSFDAWTDTTTPVLTVRIPVATLRSEHKKMDKLMAEALSADRHPEVRWELTRAELRHEGAGYRIGAQGRLTIAGVTREHSLTAVGTLGPSGWVFTGETPIRMTDFGVDPPTAMLGTIKTGNDVKVRFRWTLPQGN